MESEKGIRKESLAHHAVFLGVATSILFVESIITLLRSSRRGVFRKEVLSENTDYGFNLDIIIK